MKKVRWGLLSTAHINRRLIPAMRASKRGELVAVASRDKMKAETYAADWGIPLAFGSYAAMLESGEVDAVYISLPNHLHAEWSIKAMQAGLHVLCEKPFALSLAEVDQMSAASQQTGMRLAEAFMYRHHPQTVIAGEWAKNGRLGEVCAVRSVFNFKLGEGENVRLKPELGGGCLWDVGVYPLSLAQFIFDSSPEWVSAAQWVGESGVDEFFSGEMGYAGGGIAQIISSFRTPFYMGAEIIGTEGRLVIEKPFLHMDLDGKMWFYPAEGKPERVRVPRQELYSGEVEDMHAAILDGKPNYLTLAETREHIRTVLALYEAARTNQVVTLA